MDAQPKEDFFDISLSQEGSTHISRMFRLTRMLFAASIILTVISWLAAFLRLFLFSKFGNNASFLNKVENYLYPLYTIVVTVLLIAQMYSYFHFSRLCKRSIALRQSDQFNYSFKWLVRSAIFSLCILTAELLFSFFLVYELFYYARFVPAS